MIIYKSGRFRADPAPVIDASPIPIKGWWIGKALACPFPSCGCVFGVLEDSAILTSAVHFEVNVAGTYPGLAHWMPVKQPRVSLSVLCPECHLMSSYEIEDAREQEESERDPFDPPASDDTDDNDSDDTDIASREYLEDEP